MAVDWQRGSGLDSVEHALGLIGRGVAEVQVHPEARRCFGLGGQVIQYLLCNLHIARQVRLRPGIVNGFEIRFVQGVVLLHENDIREAQKQYRTYQIDPMRQHGIRAQVNESQ